MARGGMNKSGGATPATTRLTRAGIRFTSHSYDHDPSAASFGLEAAAALGVEVGRVFKTLVIDLGGSFGVAVLPVDHQLDLKAAAAAFGVKKATLGERAAVERSTGYVVGGISPVGQRTPLPTVLDESAMHHETVYVSGGRRGLDVELAPQDLITATSAHVAPLTKD